MILIVDDHIDTGTVLARLLKKCGQDAVAVSSGVAALKLLETTRPSVIVLGMMMPGMHEMEVLQRVSCAPSRLKSGVNGGSAVCCGGDAAGPDLLVLRGCRNRERTTREARMKKGDTPRRRPLTGETTSSGT